MPATDPGRPVVALLGLAAGLAVGALPWPARFARWPLVVGALVLVVAGSVIAASGHMPKVPSLWSDRAGLSSPDRGHATHAAVSVARGHLLFGVGPGRTTLIWTTADQKLMFDHYAHDEYLQLAMEEGLPAIVLLGVIAAGLVELMKRGRRRRPGADRLMWAGAVAGVVAIVLHSGFDFLWHVPAVVLVAGVLVGLAAFTRNNQQPGGNMIKPRWVKLALLGIVAVPAAIGLQALPAVGQSSPSVAAIRLGGGKVADRGAVALAHAIIACPAGAQAFVQVQLTERSGNGIANGYGNAQPTCTGNIQDITVSVGAQNKPFVRGTAFGQAQIFLMDGSNNSDTRNVRLR